MNENVNVILMAKAILCAIVCMLSMILTSMFAFNFVSTNQDGALYYLSVAVLITVGVVIDVSKYVFWGTSTQIGKGAYRALACVLTAFSLLASMSFFVSTEQTKLSTERQDTPEFRIYVIKRDSLRNTIQTKEKLIKKKTESAYHDQWDEAYELSGEVQKLVEELSILENESEEIGKDTAKERVSSMSFFTVISGLVGTTGLMVRNIFYGVLALLIEACSLGLISLCTFEISQQRKKQSDKSEQENNQDENVDNFERDNDHAIVRPVKEEEIVLDDKLEEIRLINDIKNGLAPPVFRKLKELDYELTQARVKDILRGLAEQGVLVPGRRNSLVLAD